MYVLRQLGSTAIPGAITDMSASDDYVQQLTDVNPRYIMVLAASGKFTSDYTQVAASGTFMVPLPQNYDTTKMLHVVMTSDQTLKLTTVSSVNGTSVIMLRAGLNQLGILTFCGQVTSMVITNSSAATANVEWFNFELPPITTNAGWRDGSLATGLLGP